MGVSKSLLPLGMPRRQPELRQPHIPAVSKHARQGRDLVSVVKKSKKQEDMKQKLGDM